MKPFALFGFKRCGKTTLGKRVAQILHLPWVDLDSWVKERFWAPSIPALYQAIGETAFRTLEEQAIAQLEVQSVSILSLGGGSLLRQQNRLALQKMCHLIYLEVCWEHLKERFTELPAFVQSREDLKTVYLKRVALFESIDADRLCLTGLDQQTSAQKIAAHIQGKLDAQ